MMQPRIQTARAVSPEEAVGVEEMAELNMFTNTLMADNFQMLYIVLYV